MFFTWNPSVVSQWLPRPDTSEALGSSHHRDEADAALEDIEDHLQAEEDLFIFDDVDVDFGEDELWTLWAEAPPEVLDRLRNARSMYPATSGHATTDSVL